MKRYAWDPGKMTGYAVCDSDTGSLIDYGQVNRDALYAILQTIDSASEFIIENFKIRPGTNFSWNDMEVLRIIGAIDFRAAQIEAKVIYQEPSVKSIGYKWNGIQVPKSHDMSHQTDAYAHLTYYNHRELDLPIPAIKRMKSEEV